MSDVKERRNMNTGTILLDLYSIEDQGEAVEQASRLSLTPRTAVPEKVLFRRIEGRDAYDTWILQEFFKEILIYKRLLSGGRFPLSKIPRNEKNLLVYLLLAVTSPGAAILELGSSLNELIDGLEVVDRYFVDRESSVRCPDIPKRRFGGIEISEFLSFAGRVLHPGYDIRIYPHAGKVDQPYGILYDRNVSSDAFTTSEELAAFIRRADAAILNIFVSRDETFQTPRLGRAITYFHLNSLLDGLDKPLFHLFGRKSPGGPVNFDLSQGRDVVEGFFLYGSEETARRWHAAAQVDAEVRAYFQRKNISLKPAQALFE
ncbi:hypothetical protein HY522_07360 [bacterium]|nr:hypothetical protein [bacterium]